MSRRSPLYLAIPMGLSLLLPGEAWAVSPSALLGSFFERANAIIRSADPRQGLDEPRRAIRQLVTEVFDFRDAAALALGPVWRSRTPREQEEFIRLFADLVERGYIAAFSSKASLAGGVRVQYFDESVAGESATVPTRIRTRSGEELPVDYRLVRRDDRWAVRDVVVDGVSLVANYRAQFTRILATSSFPDLLARMRGAPDGTAAVAGVVPPGPVPAPAAGPALSLAVTGIAGATATAGSGAPSAPVASGLGSPPGSPSSPGSASPSALASSAGSASPASALASSAGSASPGSAPPSRSALPPVPPAVSSPAAAIIVPGVSSPTAAPVVLAPRSFSGRLEATSPGPAPSPPVPAPRSLALARPDTPLSPRGVIPAVPTPAGPARSRVVYWVQVGAFKTLPAAQQMASALRPHATSIVTGAAAAARDGGASSLSRVRLGPFADAAQAASRLRELEARGYPGFIARTQD
jgi:phospholipid transport system substrate-binding protein